jgi:cytochrome c-type biogenesis protein CcmE
MNQKERLSTVLSSTQQLVFLAVAIWLVLASNIQLITLVAEMVTGDKSSKRFRETGFVAT